MTPDYRVDQKWAENVGHHWWMFPKTHHFTEVLILCVEFWELSHLTRDLSQGEKKITVACYKLSN